MANIILLAILRLGSNLEFSDSLQLHLDHVARESWPLTALVLGPPPSLHTLASSCDVSGLSNSCRTLYSICPKFHGHFHQ